MSDEAKEKPGASVASMGWLGIESAPKDGRMILVCLPSQMNLVVRARYNTIHGFWNTDCENEDAISRPTFFHEGDLWHEIPNPPNRAIDGK